MDAGVAREQARKDLPLSTYTEAYWKLDLWNLMHFLGLRMDLHAQSEIREYANIIGQTIVATWVPIAWEAFQDYHFQSVNLSRLETTIMSRLLAGDLDGARQPEPAPLSLRGTETILIVEDQEQLRKFAGRVLRDYGYRVLEAANPGEALLHSERYAGPIHLLLTDVVMPGVTGPELAGRIKPLRPAMEVLFMSGYSGRAIADRQILELAASYLQKPFSL